jgi:integrase
MGGKFKNSFQRSPKPAKTRHKLLATLLAIVLRGPKPKNVGVRKPTEPMTLHTAGGARKYLNVAERQRFAAAAATLPPEPRAFCLLLMWSGCRISEGLAVTPLAIDREVGVIAFVTLKRRKTSIVRQVPIPAPLIEELTKVFNLREREQDANLRGVRLWRWSRSTAWRWVKVVMKRARLSGSAAMPKGVTAYIRSCGLPGSPAALSPAMARSCLSAHHGNIWGCERSRGASIRRANMGELVTNNLALAVAA